MQKSRIYSLLAIPVFILVAIVAYQLPPIHDRLAWRVDEQILHLRYVISPPEKVVFVPQSQHALPTPHAWVTRSIPAPTMTATPPLTQESASTAVALATLDPTPLISPTPLPDQVALRGVRYENQHGRWNYCAPSNLAMALSFWGRKETRDDVGPALKPVEKDKNVMPYEMADYVHSHTPLQVALRVGGDLDLMKRLVAAGFPVLVEKGTYLRDISNVVSWMGHYEVVTGYNDGERYFITQDSFITPNYHVPYQTMVDGWRAFNYVYLVIYPAGKEVDVNRILGPDTDEKSNQQHAYEKASDEISVLSGINLYFAWYNRGSSLVQLQDYAGAAAAYDQAFAVYPSIPEADRPWRMLWYQTGPYFAYYYTGRYNDVVNLVNTTLDAMQSEKNLEESYYWRGMAKIRLGDQAGAIEDFKTSLTYHPGFEVSLLQLKQLGVDTP